MNREMMRILRDVKHRTSPKLSSDSDGWLIRNTCILHLYLMHKQEKDTQSWFDRCLGGGVCRSLQKELGLKEISSHCPTIHSNVYNLIKNDREIKI